MPKVVYILFHKKNSRWRKNAIYVTVMFFSISWGTQSGMSDESVAAPLKVDPNVFVTACGTSFYSQCVPSNTLHLSTCFFSLNTLSKTLV